ncbi:Zinc dependent phospholipase C [Lachnospiraceae bacterium XBB1006]|nr:Zinc dependent phospholipase C [Lachnospiraceae bacterium XBB1006]
MASWMVHLRIADKLLDKIGNLNACAFILGNIAPDSGVPNEDWSVFTPSTNVSHFKSKVDGKDKIDIERFTREYFTKEQIENYEKQEYSFFLGYYVHLLTDIAWGKMVKAGGMTRENAEKEKMPYRDFVNKNKDDWYDLDFLYLEEHPDFRAFRMYEEAEDVTNVFLETFPKDAFENRREYICGFYHSDEHGELHREYRYLTKERVEQFVEEAAEEILFLMRTVVR